MLECVDGEYQNYKVKGGAYVRKEFFGKYPELLKLVEHLSDEEVGNLRRGGHDPKKVYNAYKRATEHKGQPTVILAKTIKGYGLGEAGEGRNVTHQQKKLNEEEMEYVAAGSVFRCRKAACKDLRFIVRRRTRRSCAMSGSACRRWADRFPRGTSNRSPLKRLS